MTIQAVNPDLIERTTEIVEQIAFDISNVRNRLNSLESNCCDNKVSLPQITQLTPLALAPLDRNQLDQGSHQELRYTPEGFTDLQLAMTEWSEFDLLYTGNDLLTDSSLKTAIIISLFTDARQDNQRGWWGDSYLNDDEVPLAQSKLWTLMGKPPTPENVNLGKRYAEQALQWLLDDNLLETLTINAEHQQQGLHVLALMIVAVTTDQQRFEYLVRF